jgi:tRNA G18 (ribose-2'-O)-methylase SpoU
MTKGKNSKDPVASKVPKSYGNLQFYKSPQNLTRKQMPEDSLGNVMKKMKKLHSPGLKKQQIQEIIQRKLQVVIDHGGKIGKDILVGFNTINKVLEKTPGQICLVGIANDAHQSLVFGLLQICHSKHIPTALIPRFMNNLKSILSTKSAFCFAIKNKRNQNESEGTTNEDENPTLQAAIDDLRDFLLAEIKKKP